MVMIIRDLWHSFWYMNDVCSLREARSCGTLCTSLLVLVNLKGDQLWIFTGRTDAEAPVFWSSDANRRLTGKVPDAGKYRGQKEKRVSEDEMAGRHHWCNEHEVGQTPGDGEGQGGLACCSSWGHKVRGVTRLDMTSQLNNNWIIYFFFFTFPESMTT